MFSRKKIIIRDKHLLDPEEILIDKKVEEMGESPLVKLEWPLSSFFVKILFFICLVLILLILGRLVQLQIIKGNYYTELANYNKTRYYIINAPRGIIYDRNKEPLVLNSPSFSLTMVPLDLPRDENERSALINQITTIFDINPEDIINNLKEKNKLNSIDPILLKSNVSVEEMRKFEANVPANKGFMVMSDTSRYYPYADAAAHVLGYIGKISASDKEIYKSYPLTSMVGKDGLEAYYEKSLQGQWGRRLVEVDAYGNVKQDLGTLNPQKGNDLITTIDIGLQQELYESLKNRLQELGVSGGAGLALNPKTGEVLALVSLPSFNPNILTKGTPKNIIEDYLTSKSRPLFNRVISGLYPPGSLIKPLMAVAALEEKIIDPARTIYDEGKIVITSPYDPKEKYTFNDWQPHGWVDMRKAIAVSCNVYFWAVGGGFKDISGLGLAKIQKYWNLFNLNNKQGIDLDDENNSVLPSEDWLKKIRPNDPIWKLGDTYNISIGEGGLSLTLLQMADYISTIANNGVLMKPFLVKSIIDLNGNIIKNTEPVIASKLNVNLDNLKIVQEGMRQVVTSGTATSLNDLPIKVAGKSGSPKFISLGKEQYHAIFGAYAPYDDPQIVLLILIEKPPQGAVATIPVVHDVMSWYYENRLTTSTVSNVNLNEL
ncbi:MAG: penicillin-binding protein 2 [Parcubacteria group bacterium]|nr:penicillin-binding protein 2 [Parcubacteria group bacterium]